jgi:hypothetical protein
MASRISRLPSSDFEPELNKIGGLFVLLVYYDESTVR